MNQSQLDLNIPLPEETPSSNPHSWRVGFAKKAYKKQQAEKALMEAAYIKAVNYELANNPADKPTQEEQDLIAQYLNSQFYEGHKHIEPGKFKTACESVESRWFWNEEIIEIIEPQILEVEGMSRTQALADMYALHSDSSTEHQKGNQ